MERNDSAVCQMDIDVLGIQLDIVTVAATLVVFMAVWIAINAMVDLGGERVSHWLMSFRLAVRDAKGGPGPDRGRKG